MIEDIDTDIEAPTTTVGFMTKQQNRDPRTDCQDCPLRKLERFRDFSGGELNFIKQFKTGELTIDKGSTVLVEGSHSAHLFTILSGWSFRYKTLEDGRRQILNYALPGDIIGLQGSLIGEMEHSVEALTDLTLCVFERDRLMELFGTFPALGYDLTWIAAREERILDEHLLSVGRRSALERAAYLLSFLYYKVESIDKKATRNFAIPITQQHLADTLGLSIVHTNKTLKRLADRKMIKWRDRGCTILSADGLAKIAGWEPDFQAVRPFI